MKWDAEYFYVVVWTYIHRSVSWVTTKNFMGECRVCGSLFDLLCTENPLIGSNTPSCFLGRSCFFRYICRCESFVCTSFTLVVEDEEPTVVRQSRVSPSPFLALEIRLVKYPKI